MPVTGASNLRPALLPEGGLFHNNLGNSQSRRCCLVVALEHHCAIREIYRG